MDNHYLIPLTDMEYMYMFCYNILRQSPHLHDIDAHKNVNGIVAGQSLEESILRVAASDGRVLYVRRQRYFVDLE